MIILYFAGAFLAGAIPTAWLFGKFLKQTDIRRHGSGNVGATNAFRVLGKKAGIAVFVIDFLKGAVPVYLARHSAGPAADLFLWIGFAAILGHVFTPFLGFKGGKGFATGSGVLCAGVPMLFLWTLPVWVAVFFISRIVSIASLSALLAMVVISFFLRLPASDSLCLIVIFCLITWTHRSNIARLRQGSENRFR